MIARHPRRPAALDESELSRRRRAVHRALQPYLGDDELVQALWLWEENSTKSAFALQEFVARVCARPGLKAIHSAVYLALVKCMTLPLAELGPDPWPLMQAARRGRVVTPLPVPAGDLAGTVVFERLLDHFLLKLSNHGSDGVNSIRAWLCERLGTGWKAIGVDAGAATRIARWLSGSATGIGVALSPEALRRLLHAVYVFACEYYGPVASDAALAEAVRAVGALPEAARCPPQSFL